MNRTTAIILTIASILLCGCPGLAACAISVMSLNVSPQAVADFVQANGFDVSSVGGPTSGLWIGRIIWGVIALVLIAIPIIVGLITLRKAKKVTQ